LELGDLSYLGARISQGKSLPNGKGDRVTFSYWHDTGDPMHGVQMRIHKTKSTLRFDEFAYFFEDGVRYYRTFSDANYKELSQVVSLV